MSRRRSKRPTASSPPAGTPCRPAPRSSRASPRCSASSRASTCPRRTALSVPRGSDRSVAARLTPSAQEGRLSRSMQLRDVVPEAALDVRDGTVAISGIAAEGRKVKPGDLFVAIPGTKADGLSFVPQAIAAGAAAIAAEQLPAAKPTGVAFVKVANARRALALAAARLFPRQPGTIAAVTGTSGK